MAITRATYLEEFEDDAVRSIADDRKWSVSKTIAELVRSSPDYIEAARQLKKSRNKIADEKQKQ